MSKFWVFGYGSLIWRPGFQYTKAYVGQIKGYSRKFFQGSDVHRGRPDQLGRVVTLVKDEGATTWGIAYQMKDEDEALSHLSERESQIGGYDTFITEFYPRDSREKSFPIIVYVALPSNPLFLGSNDMDKIAQDIAHAEGDCGHNVEYLAKLVAFMKIELPDVQDDHLLTLEMKVKQLLQHQKHVLKHFEEAVEKFLISSLPVSFSFLEIDNEINEKNDCHKLKQAEDNEDEYDEDDEDDEDADFCELYSHPKLRCITKF